MANSAKMKLPNTISDGFCSSMFYLLLLASTILSWHASAGTHFHNATDRLSLLEFKYQISDDPYQVLKSWNDSQHHCQWPGIVCSSRHQRVMAVNLQGMNMLGLIPPLVGNLSFLRSISFQGNRFYGEIPEEVGHLFRLRYLNLTNNRLEGPIPLNLSRCSNLRIMDMSVNSLTGEIPFELGSLKKLETLDLKGNNLTGQIPHSFGNLSSLKELSLKDNHLWGSIPSEIGLLTNLTYIRIPVNNLSGMIPPSLFNNSALNFLSLSENQLYGTIPLNIGFTLPNLKTLYVGGNHFFGPFPLSITSASLLENLDVGGNNFSGHIPSNIGDLRYLQSLRIAGNLLGSNSSGDLSFVTSLSNCSNLKVLYIGENSFGGELPKSISNLSYQLQKLDVGGNQLWGQIPPGFDNLANLYYLGLYDNLLSGAIPSYFGRIPKLQSLELNGNRLSGQIPPSLCNITPLYSLHLFENQFEGNIPPSIGNCQHLQELKMCHNNFTGSIPSEIFSISSFATTLNLSHNLLSGSLSPEVGNLKNVNELDFSDNGLSGEIPKTLGDCSSLAKLALQGNFFQGKIPPELAYLKGLRYLNLSGNKLTGPIPKDLENLHFLEYLDLSFNDLVGEVPENGPFANTSIISLVGNRNLCGGAPELQFPPCNTTRGKHEKYLVLTLIITISGAALILAALSAFCVRSCRRQRRVHSSLVNSVDEKYPRLSYGQLHQATEGFSPGNMIGSGSFGSVYKGKLDLQEEKLVAVKVLNLQKIGAPKSFLAECRALKNVRHRNLVPILTCFSGSGFEGNEFKALVYKFMENGDLDTWLHPKCAETRRTKILNIFRRITIAIDVASALDYLHNHCTIPVIHCDLKPSNVLLDNDLTAHVGDFGLARILSSDKKNPFQSSSLGVKGTIGYAAPEYGMGGRVSTLGDVYSYGILLLEMLTGRRPTDDLFKDGFDLHDYVAKSLPMEVMDVVDPSVFIEEEEGHDDEGKGPKEDEIEATKIQQYNNEIRAFYRRDELQKCLISIFRIALACSSKSPSERINMNEVLNGLKLIKCSFFHIGRNREF